MHLHKPHNLYPSSSRACVAVNAHFGDAFWYACHQHVSFAAGVLKDLSHLCSRVPKRRSSPFDMFQIRTCDWVGTVERTRNTGYGVTLLTLKLVASCCYLTFVVEVIQVRALCRPRFAVSNGASGVDFGAGKRKLEGIEGLELWRWNGPR